MIKDTIAKKSKIEGKGVFAGRNFKKGEIVIKWDISHQLTLGEIKNLPEAQKRYIVHLERKHILLQSPAKYVNHSCDANTHAGNFCDIAVRDIKKSEEITANYSETMGPKEFLRCNCGRKKGRGVIKSILSQSPSSQI